MSPSERMGSRTAIVVAFVFGALTGWSQQNFSRVSPEAADALGAKIFQIRRAEVTPGRQPASQSVRVSEIEMESFVLYWMEDEIPPKVESINVTVVEGVIAAATELTFDEEHSTGNVLVDTLLAGTHGFYVEGALSGRRGRGRFELREVRVDGIRVPLVVVEVLVSRFVTPRFPAVDLDAPFQIPWGIEEIELLDGEARIAY